MNIANIKTLSNRDKVLLTLLAMGILALYSPGVALCGWTNTCTLSSVVSTQSVMRGALYKRVPPTSIMGKLVFT